jgi:hypothetical protein
VNTHARCYSKKNMKGLTVPHFIVYVSFVFWVSNVFWFQLQFHCNQNSEQKNYMTIRELTWIFKHFLYVISLTLKHSKSCVCVCVWERERLCSNWRVKCYLILIKYSLLIDKPHCVTRSECTLITAVGTTTVLN